jgi:4-hydroxybenzoate polyprenyltransferase
MAAAGWVIGLNWVFALAIGTMAVQAAWQICTLDLDNPDDCKVKFHSNRYLGWILLIGILAAGFRPI